MAASEAWIVDSLEHLDLEDVGDFVDTLSPQELQWFTEQLYDWEGHWARESQREPLGSWRVWLILAGRGFGKTRTGAEWVRKQVESGLAKRIAIVGRTAGDARDTMVEGVSGILAISHPYMRPRYEPSKRRLTWFNNDGSVRAIGTTYSADEPDALRGPEHDAAWADELAAWKRPEAWDNLLLGLRGGIRPRCVVTTTPKPAVLLRELMARRSTVTTGGSTYENLRNLAPEFINDVRDRYEGTHLGRQELYAELLEEAAGALWKRRWINDNRWDESVQGEIPDLDGLVVAVDPAGSKKKTSSETGIMIVGRAQMTEADGQTRPHFFVLEDLSGRFTPDGWGRIAVNAYSDHEADCIVGERNNGGDMVESTVMHVDDSVCFEDVWASRGKEIRAQPIAALYEQGRVHHVGIFAALEDQLCQWEPDSGLPSPDRLDADVWGISKLAPTVRDPKLRTNLDLQGGALARRSPWRE